MAARASNREPWFGAHAEHGLMDTDRVGQSHRRAPQRRLHGRQRERKQALAFLGLLAWRLRIKLREQRSELRLQHHRPTDQRRAPAGKQHAAACLLLHTPRNTALHGHLQRLASVCGIAAMPAAEGMRLVLASVAAQAGVAPAAPRAAGSRRCPRT